MTDDAAAGVRPGIADQLAHLVSDADKVGLVRAVRAGFDTLFTEDYRQDGHRGIDALYKRAKTTQWDADLDIDWTVGDQIDRARDPRNPMNAVYRTEEGVFGKLSAAQRAEMGHATAAWTTSQFLHAEQGAVVCAAKLVQAAPWIDAKFYAASQVMDEARHTEVYARYLREKLEWQFPVNVHLRGLLDEIVADSRWDFTYLGMQVVIEGLALAAFGIEYQMTPDPLLKQITRYVMADEARHVAFGVLSLRDVYADLTAAELKERQEFCFDAALRMRDRFLAREVWEVLGLPEAECTAIMLHDPVQIEFRRSLFAKIVPNLKKLGLLDHGDGWLRRRFGELGVLVYEDLDDTSTDYHRMDLDHAPWSVVQFQHY
ncbi:MAG: diiron oxygenase [Pseudonocardia sp.]